MTDFTFGGIMTWFWLGLNWTWEISAVHIQSKVRLFSCWDYTFFDQIFHDCGVPYDVWSMLQYKQTVNDDYYTESRSYHLNVVVLKIGYEKQKKIMNQEWPRFWLLKILRNTDTQHLCVAIDLGFAMCECRWWCWTLMETPWQNSVMSLLPTIPK